jgi:hypothetical protein
VRQFHQPHVFCPHLFGPLVRVIVASVEHVGAFGIDGRITFAHHKSFLDKIAVLELTLVRRRPAKERAQTLRRVRPKDPALPLRPNIERTKMA